MRYHKHNVLWPSRRSTCWPSVGHAEHMVPWWSHMPPGRVLDALRWGRMSTWHPGRATGLQEEYLRAFGGTVGAHGTLVEPQASRRSRSKRASIGKYQFSNSTRIAERTAIWRHVGNTCLYVYIERNKFGYVLEMGLETLGCLSQRKGDAMAS